MQKVAHTLRRLLLPMLPARSRHRLQRAYWELRWRRPDFAAPWLDRSVSAEIVEAVDGGWFPSGAPAIDLGCGTGDVAAYLAGRGFPTIGVDIAPSAVARARDAHGDEAGRLEFLAADVVAGPLPDRGFGVLVDRGCFHQLPAADRGAYVENLARVSAPDARLLLFVKAFRNGRPAGDEAERAAKTREVERAFSPAFTIGRVAETVLDDRGALPGLAFWLTRRSTSRTDGRLPHTQYRER